MSEIVTTKFVLDDLCDHLDTIKRLEKYHDTNQLQAERDVMGRIFGHIESVINEAMRGKRIIFINEHFDTEVTNGSIRLDWDEKKKYLTIYTDHAHGSRIPMDEGTTIEVADDKDSDELHIAIYDDLTIKDGDEDDA